MFLILPAHAGLSILQTSADGGNVSATDGDLGIVVAVDASDDVDGRVVLQGGDKDVGFVGVVGNFLVLRRAFLWRVGVGGWGAGCGGIRT